MESDERTERLLEEARRNPRAAKIAPRRLRRMVEVASQRLSSVRVVLENLWDTHNVSAVVRTAEGLGLDAVDVVEQPRRYRKHRSILRGADRWLSIERHPHLGECLEMLSHRDFVSCAADVGEGCIPIDEVPVNRPLAIVLGSEKHGLTMHAREVADLRFTIPMPGFTGSFNVSVSAAIALWQVTRRRRHHLGAKGDLSDDQVLTRVDTWLARAISRRGGGPAPGRSRP